MSAMAQMVADMLLKSLPEEVRVQLTPENFERMGAKIKDKWNLIEGSFNSIISEQQEQRALLTKIMERLEINDDNSSGRQLTVIDGGSSDTGRGSSRRSRGGGSD